MAHQDEKPLALRLAERICAEQSFDDEAAEKVRLCLLDFLGCTIESRDLPPSILARSLIADSAGNAAVIGQVERAPGADAAFANAVAGHGLVREDMHAGAVCHFGVVVLPPLLAVAAGRGVSGRRFSDAAIIGYEVGAKIGRALAGGKLAGNFRPTGVVGPIAAAAALAHMLGLSSTQTANALALAANTSGGLNQWPHTGSDEMFFHPGNAAASAVRCVQLAVLGATGSPLIFEGAAGLFAAFETAKPPKVELFEARPEIFDVYFKSAPVCNFAQTPFQASLELRALVLNSPSAIKRVEVRVTQAALNYPGCNHPGPYGSILQAKMSIQFAVARALLVGDGDASAYGGERDAALLDLASRVQIFEDEALTRAFPARQGAKVSAVMDDGSRFESELADVRPASGAEVRARFGEIASDWRGANFRDGVLDAVDGLGTSGDMDSLIDLFPGPS